MTSTFSGELRRLSPGLGLRILLALSMWTFLAASVRLLARLVLRYRCIFHLVADDRVLVLEQEWRLWDRPIRHARSVLPLERLEEITLEKAGESPAFFVGLSALVLGTVLGGRLLAEGVRAPGGAPWLLGTGALLVVLGLSLDYFVGSGRRARDASGPPEVQIRVTGERGFRLLRLSSQAAEALVQMIERALATGQDLHSVVQVERGSVSEGTPAAPEAREPEADSNPPPVAR